MGRKRHTPRPKLKVRARQPKDLRDTFASWLLMRTGNLASVSDQLGHSDVGVTAKHYARWMPDEHNRNRQLRPLGTDDLLPDLLADEPPTVGLSEKGK